MRLTDPVWLTLTVKSGIAISISVVVSQLSTMLSLKAVITSFTPDPSDGYGMDAFTVMSYTPI